VGRWSDGRSQATATNREKGGVIKSATRPPWNIDLIKRRSSESGCYGNLLSRLGYADTIVWRIL